MIRHVVLAKFKSDVSDIAFAELEKKLLALPSLIPEIRSYEFGLDVLRSPRSYDFAIVAGFESLEHLQHYQDHPDHREIAGLLRDIADHLLTVDFVH